MGSQEVKNAEKPASKRRTILKILNEACYLFSVMGYALTTLPMIAKRVGIDVRAIYRYFASKEAILDQLLRIMLPQMQKQIFDINLYKNLSPEQQLFQIEIHAKEFWSHSIQHCLVPRMFFELKGSQEQFIPLLKEYYSAWYTEIRTLTMTVFGYEKGEERVEHQWINIFMPALKKVVCDNLLPLHDLVSSLRFRPTKKGSVAGQDMTQPFESPYNKKKLFFTD